MRARAKVFECRHAKIAYRRALSRDRMRRTLQDPATEMIVFERHVANIANGSNDDLLRDRAGRGVLATFSKTLQRGIVCDIVEDGASTQSRHAALRHL